MSKDRMHQQAGRDWAMNHRGAKEGNTAKRKSEKSKNHSGEAATKRGSTSKA